ncbi:barstar family protein [Streptomyces sp. SPB4]|uniref:barstar family protein n=1 Tax=Streptomyces sp. SPB4 TaxID=2940553 RepID=UPI0024753B61|nr:barstar family protein [Streptomyces sp. SPB4]MDH6544870.1 RNAse (barnase) inhibitor barstar [Streptomyces sp. SPB4]
MTTAPWLHVVAKQGALPVDLLLTVTGRTYVARLDGREMRDTNAVFLQFYDKLRLPEYFGWNWNALSDCLRDLTWLSVDHCVLIVEAADEVLSGDPSEQRLLFNTLLRAGRRWSYTQRPEGIELGRLVIVMSCDAPSVPSLRERLQSCWEETASS